MPTLKQHGFSLVEALVAIATGFLVVAGITQIFSNTVSNSGDTLKLARVNQDLRAAMDFMIRDIQRAGYWRNVVATSGAGPVQATNNVFTQGVNDLQVGGGGTCLTYTYDVNYDTDVDNADPNEMFAFFLRNNSIGRRKGGTATANDCNPASWSPGSWEGITDSDQVTITELAFTITTHCLNVTDAKTGSSGVTSCRNDPDYNTASAITYAAPDNNDVLVKVRDVTITITGHPINDSARSVRITDTVRVRNDAVCRAPC
ncbi:MAG: prepilin-type N-terminal cleavage/methylation domain-containing protein [Pseudomonadota bacterium]